MRRAATLVGILLAAAAPAWGYEEDTHYYLCYVTARLGGLADREAHIVASAAQAIDEAPATTPLKWSNFSHPGGELDRLKRVLPAWHAMSVSGNEADVAKRRGELRDASFQGKGDLIGLGRYAHFTQDWYSHQPEKGRHYTAPTGHLRDRHAPDFLATDPRKAEEMARAWMKDVGGFLEQTGRPPSVPGGLQDGQADKILRMTIGKLIWAKKNELPHDEVERALNDLLKSAGLDLVVPAYDRRLTYAFDEDGTPHPVNLDRDLPPIVLRVDAASRRFFDRAREDAAAAGERAIEPARAALRALERFEAARLEEVELAVHEARLPALRRQLRDLKAELARIEKEIPPLEAEIDRLVNPKKGPCVCGAATHSACKKGKECQDVENEMRNRLVEQVRPKKARRKEILALLETLLKSVEAEEAAVQGLRAKIFREPPPDLRPYLGPDAVLSPRLIKVLPRLVPHLPAGAKITSGLRTPARQLEVLRDLALQNRVPWRDDASVDQPETWIAAWHALLAKEVFVNPPIAAKRADETLAQPSPHRTGNSFDVSGAPLSQIVAALEKARNEDGVALKFKLEPKNGKTGCVHVDILN